MTLIGDTEFASAGVIDAVRDPLRALVLDTPHVRFANVRGLRLNPHGLGPFTRLRPPPLPSVPGVYAIVNDEGEVLYVGRARDSLATRWGRRGYSVIDPRNCFVGGQSTNCHINALITGELIIGRSPLLLVHEIANPSDLEVHSSPLSARAGTSANTDLIRARA